MNKIKYRLRKKLIKAGGSCYLIIPMEWLKEQAKRLRMPVIEKLDLYVCEKHIEIDAFKEKA